MQRKSAHDLNLGRRLLLASFAAVTAVGPIAFGMLHASSLGAQELSAVYRQSLTGPHVSFDSATVKRSLSADKRMERQILPSEFVETNGSLRDLIAFAYGVNAYQVTGGPDWIDSERFNIDAHWKGPQKVMILSDSAGAPVPPPPPGATDLHMAPYRVQSMLQTLLVERFHIKLAPGAQQMAGYSLIAAEDGAKLKATPENPAPESFHGERIVKLKVDFRSGDGELTLSNGPVSALAGFLSQQLGHQVTDKTGIAGSYDIALRWTPSENAADNISEALQQQLGLKLEPQQGTVSVLAVDQAEEPAED